MNNEISARPWRITDNMIEALDGYLVSGGGCIESDYPCIDEADRKHIVACVNAIHAAGIRPGDVTAFVEAVRSQEKVIASVLPMYSPDHAELVANSQHAHRIAAVLLPENRKDHP